MRALVYHGPGQKSWDEVPNPVLIDDTDAIVKVDAATICGSDLHILKGDVPEVTDGRILGHEAVGTVTEVGSYGQCTGGGGWILGHLVDGTQAGYVRVPFADTSTYPAPAGVADEELLMLSDILPTAYEVGVLNGHVQPGDVVAVVGAGPIGLSAIMGADVAIEAVGVAATFELAAAQVRPCGHVANIGVHGQPATLHLEQVWHTDVTITTGLVDTYSTPTLLRLIGNQLDVGRFVTHHFAMNDFVGAYDTFVRAADTGALKVVVTS